MANWKRGCRYNRLINLLHRLGMLHWTIGNLMAAEERRVGSGRVVQRERLVALAVLFNEVIVPQCCPAVSVLLPGPRELQMQLISL
jgi:hypothetical protein